MEFHAEVLGRHLADGLLAPSSSAVCLGGAKQSLALRELGVAGAVAVARRRSPPLAVAFGWRERKREGKKPDKGAPPRSKPPLTSATSAAGGEKPSMGVFCPVLETSGD